jgi:ubiquinone/menaquinone biosynthesis C-methylase UbiE
MNADGARARFATEFHAIVDPAKARLALDRNYALLTRESEAQNQSQTNEVFSEKWGKYEKSDEKERLYEMQRRWYLSLYGFASEQELAQFLRGRKVILDAGCGLGYKAAWFAELAPESLVVGMDFSDAARQAAVSYGHLPNLFFVQGDIAAVPFRSGTVPYVSCDQVIMHTEDPDATFAELTRLTADRGGEFACYFYAKKALPRELLDDYFRRHCTDLSSDQLWQLSEQLTELGKRLSDLKAEIDVPDVPALGIKGGKYDLQRFIYWNFLKCFWNPDLGRETSVATNFDWYSPSNARRYDEKEVRDLVARNGLGIGHFHREEACYSGRFVKQT